MNLQHWTKEIDSVTEKFATGFGSLNKLQLNWKPGENKWSIGQNIAHLIQLNKSYFQHFDEIKKGNHHIPRSNNLQSIALQSLQALAPYTNTERIKRAATWSIWQPAQKEFDLKIFEDFTSHQSDFKTHIEQLQPFFTQETFIKYPGETELLFKLEDCIDFLITHEKRHLLQAEEVKHNFYLL